MSDGARVGRAASWTMAARLVRFVTGFALSIVVVRGLGPDGFGQLALVRTTLTFVTTLCYLGMGQAMLRFLPELRQRGDGRAIRRLIGITCGVQALMWGIAALAAAACVPWGERLFHQPGIGGVLLFGTMLLVADLAVSALQQVATAWYELRAVSIATAIAGVVLVLGTWAALHAGWGVRGVLAASAACNAGIALVLAREVLRILRGLPEAPAAAASGIPMRRLLHYALPFTAISILNLIVWRQSETLILGHYRSAAEVGWFDLAYGRPQQVLEFIPVTLWPLVMAAFADSFTRDAASLSRRITLYYKFLAALALPIAIGGAVLSPRAIPLIFGAANQPAAWPTAVFFVLFAVSFGSTPLSMALYVLERTPLVLAVYAVQAVVNVGFDLVLIPRYGVWGAVIPVGCVVTTAPLVYAGVLRAVRQEVHVPWDFLRRMLLASCGWCVLLPFLPMMTSLPRLALGFAAGAAAVLAGVRWARVVGPEEERVLQAVRIPLTPRVRGLLGLPPVAAGGGA